jgi:hypothetical protein
VAYWILASALCVVPIKWYKKLNVRLISLNGLVILRNVFNLQPSKFLWYLNTSWMVSLFLWSFNCGPALISTVHSIWPWDFWKKNTQKTSSVQIILHDKSLCKHYSQKIFNIIKICK